MNYPAFIARHGRFLGFGLLMTFASSFGQTFFVALFSADIRAEFDLSDGDFGWLYGLATLASALLLGWLGAFVDRVDLRLYASLVLAGLAGAALVTALAPLPWVLLLGVAGLRLFGQGLCGHAASTSMARYFDEGRGKAVGLAPMGVFFGQMVFPILAVELTQAIGWRNLWVLAAALIAALLLPVMLWTLGGQTRRHQNWLDRQRDMSRDDGGRGSPQFTRGDVLRDRRFWLILPGALAMPFVITGIFFHQVRILEAKGWALEFWAASFAVYSAGSIFWSLVGGWLVDRFGAARLAQYTVAPLAVAVLGLSGLDFQGFTLMFFLLISASVGLSFAVFSALWAELYGTLHLGAIRSVITPINVFSTAAAPVIFGVLLDAGVAAENTLVGFGLYCVVALVLLKAGVRQAVRQTVKQPIR